MTQKGEITINGADREPRPLIERLRRAVGTPTALLIDHGFNASTWETIRRRRRRWRLFLLMAVLFGAFAGMLAARWLVTPLYQVDARFVIRSGENAAGAPGVGGGVLSVLGAGALTDGYAVRDYLQSVATYDDLEKTIGYTALMTMGAAQPADRNNLDMFLSNVKVRFNLTEQIVVISAFAPEPGNAKRIVDAMLAAAERFADTMNERARKDWLRTTNAEFEAYENKLRLARERVTKWRLDNALIDPSASVTAINTNLQQLESQLVQARINRDRILSLGRQHPALPLAETTVAEIERQLRFERERLGKSPAKAPIAPTLAEYEHLKVEQELAEKNLENGLRIREQAHLQLVRQQKYVVVVSPSHLPHAPSWPQPLVWALLGACGVLGLMLVVSAFVRA